MIQGKEGKVTADKKGNEVGAFCEKVNVCRSLNAKGQNSKFLDSDGKTYHDIKSAETKGYTSDCFYDGTNSGAVSDNPAQREECCCINAKQGTSPLYYQPNDVDPVTNFPVHESKTASTIGQEIKILGQNDFDKMKWSYRYWKEKFETKGTDGNTHKEYNPNRYIEGRDLPACFGQNNLLYEYILQQPEKVLTVDPFRQHEAALQCVHLAGISNRLQFIKNLMTSMSTCLIQVRTTGRGDAGACKELFSQYLCSAIWQVIRWFVDGCTPIGTGIDFETQDDNMATYVRAGFKGVYQSLSDLQSSMSQEYGNAKFNEMLGTGEESIARKICLGAFGYDWEFNVKNLVDAAYATPFATLVQPVTKSREFLTVDPVSFKPKYEYRASWIINPGCDFERYDVYLACVGRKQLDQYPNSVNCGALGAPSIAYTGALGTSAGYSECDCINLPDEKVGELIYSGKLKQNVLEDNKAFHKVIDSNVRYDHLKFVLRPDRKILSNVKPNCFPTGYDDGIFYFPIIDKSPKDILDCRADPLSGTFYCGEGATFATRKGVAYFIDAKVNGIDSLKTTDLVFSLGDTLTIDTTIFKMGSDKCLKLTLGNENQVTGITINGTNQYSVQLEKALASGQKADIVEPTGIKVQRVSSGNSKDVSINVRFFDIDNDNLISLDKGGDKVVIDSKTFDMQELVSNPAKSYFVNEGKPNEEVEVMYTEQRIMLKKQGAQVEIVEATLQKDSGGNFYKAKLENIEYSSVGGSIGISAPSSASTTQTTQAKTLVLGLYHIKDNVESYTGNPDDCAFNDPVMYDGKPQARTITIKVESKATAATQGPIIQTPIKTTPSSGQIKKGDTVSVSATIKDSSGVKSTNVDCKKPDGEGLTTAVGTSRNNDVFEYSIFSSDITMAGKYSCTLTAESKNEKAKTNTQSFDFEVQCGEENNYGLCKTSCPDKEINVQFVCTSSLSCCKT